MALVGDMQILIPLAGLIDKEAELVRLEKEMAKLATNLEKGRAKLQNPNFVDKAPVAVVDKERQRVEEMEKAMQQLQQQAEKIRAL
jgi:valyl-tRNA synthetase